MGETSRLFYGRSVVAFSVVCISASPQPFVFGSIGFFMVPLREEFGWTRSQISACITVFTLTTAIFLSIIGRLIDRFGAKEVLVPSVTALGLCTFGLKNSPLSLGLTPDGAAESATHLGTDVGSRFDLENA